MTTVSLSVFDRLHFVLSTPTTALAEQLCAFFAASFVVDVAGAGAAVVPSGQPQLQIPIPFHLSEAQATPIHNQEPFYEAADLAVWTTETGFVLHCGASWLALNLEEQHAHGAIYQELWQRRPQDQRDFFLLPLLMFAHRNGAYGLHANGISDGVTDYLVIGPSGSGKSTLTVQLLNQGWQYSGDDVVVLQQAAPSLLERKGNHPQTVSICIHALRREFALSAQTLRVSQCAPPNGVTVDASEKQIVAPPSWQAAQFVPCLRPTRLLFATIVPAAESTLQPLTQSAALIRLAQQSAGIFTQRTVAKAQLDLLSRLLRQAQPYQLALGRDLLANPGAVASLLQTVANERS